MYVLYLLTDFFFLNQTNFYSVIHKDYDHADCPKKDPCMTMIRCYVF